VARLILITPLSCFSRLAVLLFVSSGLVAAAPQAPPSKEKETVDVQAKPEKTTASAKPETKPADPQQPAPPDADDDETAAEKKDAESAAVALPVSPEPVQVYGWREHVLIEGMKEKLLAKLDTGALTSSIHAEKQELFERDGKKWVRFTVASAGGDKTTRVRLEAPLVRIARIKEPNAESVTREVVRLSFRIGDRKLRAEFTLNNRNNMIAPVLIGRSTLKDLGWVDPAHTHLADQKVFR
jgi:hypothetical protein